VETSYTGKPYFFVPMIGSVDRRRALNRQKLLSSNAFAGKFSIKIECMTPLHFGSGRLKFDEVEQSFKHSLLRENKKIALPGSSFKGMLRTVFESVTASCVLLSPKALPRKIGNLKRCECDNNLNLCPACSVFGCLSYKGKLIISSFYTTPNIKTGDLKIPPLNQPFKTYSEDYNHKSKSKKDKDPKTGNERLYYGDFSDIHGLDVARMKKDDFFAKKEDEHGSGGNFYGRKFYKHSGKHDKLASGKDSYECLLKGAILEGEITYQGLNKEELGALLFALGLGWGKPIFHKLGYAKPAFLGSVKLTITPKPLSERHAVKTMTLNEVNDLAEQYYSANESPIKEAVSAFEQQWLEIGRSNWLKEKGKYGY